MFRRRTALFAAIGLVAALLVSISTATSAQAACQHFTFGKSMVSKFVVVGKKRSGGYFYLATENIGTAAGKIAAQAECGSRTKFVTIKRGQVHTFKVPVGSRNPLVRLWFYGSSTNIPAGTYPSKKGAFTIPADSHPYLSLSSTNTTGHKAVLNLAKGKPSGSLTSWTAAPATTNPGGSAHVKTKVAPSVQHVRGGWFWGGGHKIVLDAPMLRLNG